MAPCPDGQVAIGSHLRGPQAEGPFPSTLSSPSAVPILLHSWPDAPEGQRPGICSVIHG